MARAEYYVPIATDVDEAAGATPIIAFCNSRSGGGQGRSIMRALSQSLGEHQVFDLSRTQSGWSPTETLREHTRIPNIRVLVCGGDGTVGWIMSCLDNVDKPTAAMPLAVMPLGTGNDLSRSLGWGPGFSRRMVRPSWLQRVARARAGTMDRWQVTVSPCELESPDAIALLPRSMTVAADGAVDSDATIQVANAEGAMAGQRADGSAGAVVAADPGLTTPAIEGLAANVTRDPLPEPDTALSPPQLRLDPPVAPPSSQEGEPALATAAEDGSGSGAGADGQRGELAEQPTSEAVPLPMPARYRAVMCNYFSIGLDGKIALAFHQHRERAPRRFSSRLRNLAWYGYYGFTEGGALCCSSPPPPPLDRIARVYVQRAAGEPEQELVLPRGLQCLIVSNLRSYLGGSDIWGGGEHVAGEQRCTAASMCDGRLEVAGLRNVYHMCVRVRIVLSQGDWMQLDGEPWLQRAPCEVAIAHHGVSAVLHAQ